MRILEITVLDNGAHRNQSSNSHIVPEGWAVIPETMTLENFPFGEVEAEEINGVMTVTKWTPGTVPEPEPEEEAEAPVDTEAIIIETLIDQEIRLAELELALL